MPRIDDRGWNVGSGFATTDLVEHGAAFLRAHAFQGFRRIRRDASAAGVCGWTVSLA
jgi:hypothetical protein